MRVFNRVIKVSFHNEGNIVAYNEQDTRFHNPMHLNPEDEEQNRVLNIVLFSDGIVINKSNYKLKVEFSTLIIQNS